MGLRGFSDHSGVLQVFFSSGGFSDAILRVGACFSVRLQAPFLLLDLVLISAEPLLPAPLRVYY